LCILTAVESLQTKKHNDIKISFRGNEIDNLRKAIITFINLGNVSIRRDDVSPSQPITIELIAGDTILDCEVIHATNLFAGIKIERINNREIVTSFDYLDPKEGFVVEILYESGNSDRKYGRTIKGHVIDSLEPIILHEKEHKSKETYWAELTIDIILLLFAAFIFYVGYGMLTSGPDQSNDSIEKIRFILSLGILGVAICTMAVYRHIKKFPHNIPKEFLKYFSERYTTTDASISDTENILVNAVGTRDK
jgi:hypothetical protein